MAFYYLLLLHTLKVLNIMNPAMRQENAFWDLVWFVSPENVSVLQGNT